VLKRDKVQPSVASRAVELAAATVPEFCESHRISRALFYILQREGTGPRVMRVRRRTLITADAAADWRRRMEQATEAA
jgi:hypothetical protein